MALACAHELVIALGAQGPLVNATSESVISSQAGSHKLSKACNVDKMLVHGQFEEWTTGEGDEASEYRRHSLNAACVSRGVEPHT